MICSRNTDAGLSGGQTGAGDVVMVASGDGPSEGADGAGADAPRNLSRGSPVSFRREMSHGGREEENGIVLTIRQPRWRDGRFSELGRRGIKR